MEKIISLLKYSKLPTITLIAMLLFFSNDLIKGEEGITPSSIEGFVIGITALLFAIFSYADYRAREKIDHILSKYESALNNISMTHSRYEKEQRNTIANTKERQIGSNAKGRGYEMDDGFGGTADDVSDL